MFADTVPFTPNSGMAASQPGLDNAAIERDNADTADGEEYIPNGQPDEAASMEEHVLGGSSGAAVSQSHTGGGLMLTCRACYLRRRNLSRCCYLHRRFLDRRPCNPPPAIGFVSLCNSRA